MTAGLPLRRMHDLARDAAAAGFSGLVITESGRTAYLGCTAAALAADIDILTGVAVAFPRSPMVTASVAWELAELTGGRFRLGLGTQVRAHIERRYGVEFDHPGPRLREYVLALRAIFESFRSGAPLAHAGEYWKLSLLPAMWSPGAIEAPDPPIDIAAVNPWMLRLAGEVADGVLLNYLPASHVPWSVEQVRAGGDATIYAYVHVGVAKREDGVDLARRDLFSYAVVDAYARNFERAGYGDSVAAVREAHAGGDREKALASVSDEMVDGIDVIGDPAHVQATMQAYVDAGVQVPVVMPLPWGPDRMQVVRDTLEAAI